MLLVHPGGPFFARKDEGAWSIPTGTFSSQETPLDAARREFLEEIGIAVDSCARGAAIPLGTIRQRGGKVVHAFAYEGDLPEGASLRSNTFEVEWPPHSGKPATFPEIDRAEFFPEETARRK